jgi:hypothetical protein
MVCQLRFDHLGEFAITASHRGRLVQRPKNYRNETSPCRRSPNETSSRSQAAMSGGTSVFLDDQRQYGGRHDQILIFLILSLPLPGKILHVSSCAVRAPRSAKRFQNRLPITIPRQSGCREARLGPRARSDFGAATIRFVLHDAPVFGDLHRNAEPIGQGFGLSLPAL